MQVDHSGKIISIKTASQSASPKEWCRTQTPAWMIHWDSPPPLFSFKNPHGSAESLELVSGHESTFSICQLFWSKHLSFLLTLELLVYDQPNLGSVTGWESESWGRCSLTESYLQEASLIIIVMSQGRSLQGSLRGRRRLTFVKCARNVLPNKCLLSRRKGFEPYPTWGKDISLRILGYSPFPVSPRGWGGAKKYLWRSH